MTDFLRYLSLFNYAEVLTLFVSVFQYIRGKKWLGIVVFFAAVSVTVEVFLGYILALKYNNNDLLYNIYSFFCPAFYLYMYNRYFISQSWSKILRYTTIAWFAISIVVLVSSERSFESFPYYSGMEFTTILIFVYFYQTLYLDDYRDLTREGMFYFSLGLILFIFTSFTILVFFNELTSQDMPVFFFRLLQFGNLFLWAGCLGLVLCPKMW